MTGTHDTILELETRYTASTIKLYRSIYLMIYLVCVHTNNTATPIQHTHG